MISPAGVILLLYIWYKKNDLSSCIYISFVLSLFIGVGYFVKLGSIEVSYGQFFALYSIAIFFIKNDQSLSSRQIVAALIFFILFLLSYANVILGLAEFSKVFRTGDDYNNGILSSPRVSITNVNEIINITIFSFFIMILKSIDKKNLLQFIIKSGKIIIVIAIFEFISKYFFVSDIFLKTVSFIFGEGIYQIDFIFDRGGLPTLQGLTREPNHFVSGLLIWMAITVILKKREFFFLPLSLIIIFISGSFAGSAFLIFIFIIIYVHNFNYKNAPALIFFVLLVPIIFYFIDISYYQSRLINLTEDIRVLSLYSSLKAFSENPLLGIGLGNSMSFSTTLTLLSNLGILGTLSWGYMCKVSFSYNFKSYCFLAMFFLLFVFVGGKGTIYSISTILIFMVLDKKLIATYSAK